MTIDDRFTAPGWEGWHGPSTDPNDRQFGDVIAGADPPGIPGVSEPSGDSDAVDPDIVLVGEPYDGAVIGRRGAREGPLAIRRSLAGVKTARCRAPPDTSDGPSTLSPVSAARFVDLGDVQLSGVSEDGVEAVQDHVRRIAGAIHGLDSLPVFLGGDNSLTYANVAPLVNRGSDSVAVVNFDAHLDCRALSDGPTSGTPYRQLLEAGLDVYVAVGARHFETSGSYVQYVHDHGGTVVPADAFDGGQEGAIRRVFDAVAEVDHLYLSIDCDVLDATAAPGVSAPTPGGLTTRELFAAVGALARDDRLIGVEVVECAPPLAAGGRTADAAARTVAHALDGHLRANHASSPSTGNTP